MRVGLLAAIAALLGSFATMLPAKAGPDCGAGVLFAQLVAVGSAHHYGEYLIQLAPPGGERGYEARAPVPISVTLDASGASGQASPLNAEGVFVTTPVIQASRTNALLVVLPSADVRSFSLVSTGRSTQTTSCSPVKTYDLPAGFAVTHATFDDDAAWVKVASPIAVTLEGPKWTNRSTPDGSGFDSKFSDEADVAMSLVIGDDGSLADATVVRSSGQPRIDAASLEAARESRYSPAHLPAQFGGSPVAVKTFVVYTFMAQ